MGMFDWVDDAIKAAKKAVLDPIMKPINAVGTMIKTFNRIVCFIEKFPVRIRNVKSGVINIADGIETHIAATGTAAEIGFESITDLGESVGIIISTHSECIIKFIINLIYCIWFYILDVFGYFLYLIIYGCIWLISGLLIAIPLNTSNPAEKIMTSVFEGIYKIDSFLYKGIRMHIAHYPKLIRESCYICKTLKNTVVSKKAANIDKVFTYDIPELFGDGNKLIKRGANQFDQAITQIHPKEPKYVK